jgi:hypothetical protein
MNRTLRGSAMTAFAALLLVATACSGPPGSSPTGTTTRSITGRATAGPVCPVERNPPDPACAARPVAGAVLVFQNLTGAEVARAITDQNGHFGVALAPGVYRLVPQAVAGLMGGGRPLEFQVKAGQTLPPLAVAYDTGIR